MCCDDQSQGDKCCNKTFTMKCDCGCNITVTVACDCGEHGKGKGECCASDK